MGRASHDRYAATRSIVTGTGRQTVLQTGEWVRV
jgi:hypothetical protein